MNAVRHKVIYLSHGAQAFHDQARYSALTLLDLLLRHQRSDVHIFMYTDRPEQVPAHPLIHAMPLTDDELGPLRGPLDYVHRIKLEILRRAEAEIGLPFIYVDCDTRWLSLPLDVFESLHAPELHPRPLLYMHVFEELVSATSSLGYFRLLTRKTADLAAWNLRTQPPWPVWNAGTIAVPGGAEGLFEEVLRVNDGLLPDAEVRRTIEQLALSLVVTERFEVRPFDRYLRHWWAFGYELPAVLRQFFAGLPPDLGVERLAAECGHFEPTESALLAVRQTPEFRRAMAREKRRKSIYKRKIALKALWLRLTRG